MTKVFRYKAAACEKCFIYDIFVCFRIYLEWMKKQVVNLKSFLLKTGSLFYTSSSY